VLAQGLFGSNDATARLIVALCGVGLVLVPALYRRWLGPTGALAAALLLALSPIALASARTLSSETPVALFGALALAGLLHALAPAAGPREAAARHAHSRNWALGLGGAALGVALAAGAGIYSLLVLALVSAGVWWRPARSGAPIGARGSRLCRTAPGGWRSRCWRRASRWSAPRSCCIRPAGAAGDLLIAWLRMSAWRALICGGCCCCSGCMSR
jgi:hypothetical protein